MNRFPNFMKNASNRIAPTAQHTAGIEGYVFDGADGTQMAFWECNQDTRTEAHVHEFDEYFIVVEDEARRDASAARTSGLAIRALRAPRARRRICCSVSCR